MYLGRIIAVGMTTDNKLAGLYRVSSRSFPNREAINNDGKVSIVLKKEFLQEAKNNPYITYNCLIQLEDYLLVSNGSHTDFIAQKLDLGHSSRDALVSVLSSMDFEYDQLDTPRIAGIVNKKERTVSLGIVRRDGIEIKTMPCEAGKVYYISTYEHNYLNKGFSFEGFSCGSSEELCDYILHGKNFSQFPNPVTAVCGLENGERFDLAIKNLV